MSTVQEIEAAIPKLPRAEVEELRAWIEDYLEDTLELTDEVKAKLDQSRREIAEGHYITLVGLTWADMCDSRFAHLREVN
jgi:hypothetical protein